MHHLKVKSDQTDFNVIKEALSNKVFIDYQAAFLSLPTPKHLFDLSADL